MLVGGGGWSLAVTDLATVAEGAGDWAAFGTTVEIMAQSSSVEVGLRAEKEQPWENGPHSHKQSKKISLDQ